MDQLLKDYEGYLLAGHWALSSTLQYVSEAKRFVKKTKKRPEEIDRKDVQQYLVRFPADKERQGYEASTRHRKLAALRVFFDFLIQEGLLTKNPCEGIRGGKIPYKHKLIPTEKEIEEFFEILSKDTSLAGKKILALIATIYYLGLRVNEGASLDVSHVIAREPLQIRVRRKGGNTRIFPVENKKLLSFFLPWWSIRKTFQGPTPSLFINLQTKSRLSVRTIQRRMKMLGEAAAFPMNLHPHFLRSCFATHLYIKGVDLPTISGLLDHSRIEITKRHYVFGLDPKQRAALLVLP